jgi:hypothetical protein
MSVEYIDTPQAIELATRLRRWEGHSTARPDGYAYPKILWIGEHVFLSKTVGYNYDGYWHSPQIQLRSVEKPEGYLDAHNWTSRCENTLMVVKRSSGAASWRDHFDGPCGPLTEKALAGLIADAEAANARWEDEEEAYRVEQRAGRKAQEEKEKAADALKAAREKVWATKEAVVDAAVAWAKDEGCAPATIITNASALLGAVAAYESALAALAKLEGE